MITESCLKKALNMVLQWINANADTDTLNQSIGSLHYMYKEVGGKLYVGVSLHSARGERTSFSFWVNPQSEEIQQISY